MEPVQFKLSDIEPHLGGTKLGKLYEALTKKYTKDGLLEPGQRAKVDIARLLSAAFTKIGDHWEGVKAGSLARLGKLQVKALEFYKSAMGGKKLDVEGLRTILRDMDKEFRTIAKDTQKLAEEHPPVTRETSFNRRTGETTTKLDGGAEAGGATYVEGGGKGKRGKVVVQGPHPGRPKGELETPAGFLRDDHRGHGAGEGAVDNPNLVNVLENIEGETSASNLGPKKRFDNLVSKTAAAFYDRVVTVLFERVTKGNDPRPIATKYEIQVDGVSLYKVTIPND